MTIKEIKEHYKVVTYDRGKTLLLEDKNEHGRYNVGKFIVALERIKTGVYRVAASKVCGFSMETSNWNILTQLIDDHVSRYEFSSEFYNPMYREGYFEEIAVSDYLREHLEFKHIDTQWGIDAYEKEFEGAYKCPAFSILLNICGLDMNGVGFGLGERKKSDEVTISYCPKGGSWVEVKCKRNAREICETIDGLLKPIILMNAVKCIDYTYLLATKDIEPIYCTSSGTFNVDRRNVKKELIEQLEKTLKTLKGE